MDNYTLQAKLLYGKTENINCVGGAGTGAFAKEVIDFYLSNL